LGIELGGNRYSAVHGLLVWFRTDEKQGMVSSREVSLERHRGIIWYFPLYAQCTNVIHHQSYAEVISRLLLLRMTIGEWSKNTHTHNGLHMSRSITNLSVILSIDCLAA
jgi:hypothetical protein